MNYYEDKKGFVIEDYLGSDTNILLPSEAIVNGVSAPIVGIGGYAFANRSVKEIRLPNSIHSIGAYAFYQSQLQNLYATPYLVDIDKDAFANCPINFNEKDRVKYLPIENAKFGYAVSFSGSANADIQLPQECEAVYDNVFTGAQKIHTHSNMKGFGSIGKDCIYILPSDYIDVIATKVGDYAFQNCKTIKTVTISEGASSVGSESFLGCSSLESVSIPSSVTHIGKDIFYQCVSLHSIVIPFLGETEEKASNLNYFFKESDVPSSLKKVEFGSSCTSIDYCGFTFCSYIESVIIPNSVTSIGDSAFYGCSSLTSLTIPNSVISIGALAFYNCSSLSSIVIPFGVTSIEERTFGGCKSLTSITIPNSVTSIKKKAFANCVSLTSIIIPDSVSFIDETIFYGCSSLETISIPFVGSAPDKAGIITNFYGFIYPSAPKNVIIGNACTSIGKEAFRDCSSLESILISESVTSIGGYAFSGCSSLKSIFIPANVVSISNSAFTGPMTIYCEASSKPSGWDNNWCDASSNAVWGYKE